MSNPRPPLVPAGAEIASYELPQLHGRAMPTYQQIKATFDPGSMPKQNRFALSELVAGQLSVEQEEQRRFDKKVNEEVDSRLKIIKAEAHSAAHARGLEEGRARAYDEEKARIASTIEGLLSATGALADAKLQLAEQYEKVLVDTIFRVARVIVHTEVKTDPALIAATVAAILERIAKEDDVRVRISNVEFDAIEEIKSEVEKLSRGGRIHFEMDSTLKAGNCIVQSLSGEIASNIEEKFELLRGEIEKGRAKRQESTGT